MKVIIKKIIIWSFLISFSFCPFSSFAQKIDQNKPENPFNCISEVDKFFNNLNIKEINEEIRQRIKSHIYDAQFLCTTAELMKRVGDYRAEKYYEKAIKADETESVYELFYADYLRNFRGAEHPLFPEATEHYFKALKKLKLIKKWGETDHEKKKRIERGLTTLYQEDGFPLDWKSKIINSKQFLEKPPFVFLAIINKYAKLTTDFDEVDDTRDFTSEALFASSKTRLNHPLTKNELKGIIRTKEQFETLDRLRFRYGHWPVLDIFYKYRKINDAQITNFREPNKFNDTNLNEYGIALEKPLNFSPYCDLFLMGIYKKADRQGIIEFLPNEREDIDHYEAKATITRFWGANKVNLKFTYMFQNIKQDIPKLLERNRQIVGTTFIYQVFRQKVYKQIFEPRGLDFLGGIATDREKYGDTIVEKRDFFVGSAFKGLFKNALDITIQPTIFTYKVEDDKTRDNSQYRTDFTLLFRVKDEEDTQKDFVHLVIPLRHDVAIDGPDNFENFKVGFGLNTKIISDEIRRTTFLISASYDYQDFYKVDKNLNLFKFNVSMGF